MNNYTIDSINDALLLIEYVGKGYISLCQDDINILCDVIKDGCIKSFLDVYSLGKEGYYRVDRNYKGTIPRNLCVLNEFIVSSSKPFFHRGHLDYLIEIPGYMIIEGENGFRYIKQSYLKNTNNLSDNIIKPQKDLFTLLPI